MEKIERNDPCWCGSGKKYKTCHMNLDSKIHQYELKGHIVPSHDILKMEKDLEGIRKSSKINMAVLDAVEKMIGPGISTQQIDDLVHDMTIEMGGIPAPLNYEGFPKSVCTSINEVVCHGIPDPDRILVEGDIVNVDVSTIYNGYFSDSSICCVLIPGPIIFSTASSTAILIFELLRMPSKSFSIFKIS